MYSGTRACLNLASHVLDCRILVARKYARSYSLHWAMVVRVVELNVAKLVRKNRVLIRVSRSLKSGSVRHDHPPVTLPPPVHFHKHELMLHVLS